jgi:DNA-directed RNA polymerase specialized sigma24 family protein
MIQVVEQLRNGDLREPNRLPGYVHIIVTRYLIKRFEKQREMLNIDKLAIPSATPSAEVSLAAKERQEIAARVLRSMGARDREMLIRCFLQEQTPEEIRDAMGISETVYRLVKSRARARFEALCREAMLPKRIRSETGRTAAACLSA